MQEAKKGTWVQVHSIILKPEERTAAIPEDTKKVPVEMWVKGYLDADAKLGDSVTVTTVTGRKENGTLCAIEPGYTHDYGAYVPELSVIREQVKKELGV